MAARGARGTGAGPASLRLFVALELPDDVRGALGAWSSGPLAAIDAVRPVASESLHLTLCFLGATPASAVEDVGSACAVAVAGRSRLSLALGGAVGLPRRRPRVVAVEVGGDGIEALGSLQAAVSSTLATGGWYRPETRPFLAHVTVARVRPRCRIDARVVSGLPDIGVPPFVAETVTLWRSHTHRSGARYEPLLRVALAA